jgi:hypothetical protein
LNRKQNNPFACIYQPAVFGGAGNALLFFAELQRQEQRADRDIDLEQIGLLEYLLDNWSAQPPVVIALSGYNQGL